MRTIKRKKTMRLDELIEVYRKAKVWDKYKAHMESHIAGEINEEELVSDLKSDYLESGASEWGLD